MNTDTIFAAVCAAAVLLMLIYYSKRPNKQASAAFGSITGVMALLAAEKAGSLLGISIVLNIFNIIGSLILGVPYVVILVIMNFL